LALGVIAEVGGRGRRSEEEKKMWERKMKTWIYFKTEGREHDWYDENLENTNGGAAKADRGRNDHRVCVP
jgi:hypothetical protein